MVQERGQHTFMIILSCSIRMSSFPSLEREKIDTVIHMGDIFDSRKSIDLSES